MMDTREPSFEASELQRMGVDYFWSQFGGWKAGRADRDDDASQGYISLGALYREVCYARQEAELLSHLS